MAPVATVLIPTHEHSALLPYSVRSALGQTVSDLEVLIVGDGVDEATRDAATAVAESDERARFIDRPKGARLGEEHRGPVLGEARGSIVCYLSDDDLWLPEHVETMLALLAQADFASAMTLCFHAAEKLEVLVTDFADPFYRELMASDINRTPLSGGAHTMDMYRRLPHGWRTTPEGTHTDLHMWRQFIADDSCRTASAVVPTVLNFPSPDRREWSPEQRAHELAAWSERIARDGPERPVLAELADTAARSLVSEWGQLKAYLERQNRETIHRGRRLEQLEARRVGEFRELERRADELKVGQTREVRELERRAKDLEAERAHEINDLRERVENLEARLERAELGRDLQRQRSVAAKAALGRERERRRELAAQLRRVRSSPAYRALAHARRVARRIRARWP